MALEVYAIIILFAITVSAYVTAVNAHGVARTVVSYVLATLILLLSVFTLLKYNSQKELALKEAERQKVEEQLRKAEEDARLAAAQAAAAAVVVDSAALQGAGDYKPLIDQGLSVAKTILSVDVDGEFDYDKVTGQAASCKAQAADLKKRLDALAKPSDPNMAALRDQVDKGLRALGVAANYFGMFFKAENENEEDQRWEVYQNNAKSARSLLTQAASRLEGK